MVGTGTDEPQGPFESSRCVAGPGGRWGHATIRRVNEDGTFKLEFDVKELVVLPYWYGVTPAEVSFDDPARWAGVFARLSPGGRPLARVGFPDALAGLGYAVPAEQALGLWDRGCQALFGSAPGQADRAELDEAAAYRLFLQLGVSAKQCADNLPAGRPPAPFKLYWNQTRMGGRTPAELPRAVTLGDAYAALGLAPGRVDRRSDAFLRRVEQEHAVRLPATLAALLRCEGAARAVTDCHPNNPSLLDFDAGAWSVLRGMRERGLGGECAVVFAVPHQGDHEWAAVFDDGAEDARVYVRWEGEDGDTWLESAPGVAMFFWDLAQTGLGWYQATRHNGGKRVRRTDIGLSLES